MAESNREEIAKLEALYANNPGGRVFTHLAEAYRKAGDLKQAREILEEGLTRHTDYASAYVVLGRVLVDQGAAPEAAAAFRRVLQLDHENRVALRSLGDLARTSDAPAEALTYYHQLQHLDPTDDDLNETIDALTARVNEAPAGVEPVAEEAPAPQPAAPEPIAVAAPEPPPAPEPEPEPMAEPEPWAEPEPMVAEAAAPVESPPPVVTTDYGMDWAASDETTEELPGDLAAFVQSQTAQAGPTEELADTLPPFDVGFEEAAAEATAEPMTEPVGEPFGDISLDAPAEEPEAEPAVDFGIGDFAIDPAAEGAETFATEAAAPWTPEDVSDEPFTTEAPEATLEREEAEAPRESSFEELLSSSTSGMSPLAEAGAQEDMPTETLAELYRSQGLADRAAGVYRTLLLKNPADPLLLAKLSEVELAPARAPEEASPPEALPQPAAHPEGREAWHEGVAAWTGGEQAAAGGPSPYDWSHEGDLEETGGVTVAQYLQQVLSWRPQNTGDFMFDEGADDGRNVAMMDDVVDMMAVTEPPSAAIVEPSPAPAAAEEPIEEWTAESAKANAGRVGEAPAPPQAEAPGVAPAALEAPVAPPAMESPETPIPAPAMPAEAPEPAPPTFAAAPEAPPVGPISPPAPLPTPAFAAPAPAAAASAPAAAATPAAAPASYQRPPVAESSGSAVDAAFDEWFAEPGDTPAPPATIAQATVAPEPPAAIPEAPGQEETDDDLEMFRSWLQSLKK